ncbi:molybdopterin-dependent oxidoreductase [Oryzobacter telluris]|uniref:molybdopterin-dependent oxidoreductase n=1 Tax=Oryzobacter telluris TaxID=3149179 RepID=UPI00370DC105
MSLLSMAAPAPGVTELGFPWWLQVTHLLNFLFLGLLLRSGWEILASHPRLYWRNDCGPDTEWLKFTKDRVPSEVGAFTARDDQRSLHPLVSLPGRGKIALGRAWHGLVTTAWVLNGLVYVGLLFGTGQWRRIVPTSWDVLPEAWESATVYAGFSAPAIEHFQPYDALQMLGYSFIVFVVAPLMIVTGPVMSPAVVGRYPWYPKLFGGRQAARSIHFIGMAVFVGFIVMHVALVFLVYPEHNLVHMMMGVEYDPALVAQAVTRTVIGITAVVVLWIAASYGSLIDVRKSQRVLYGLQKPLKKWVLGPMTSRQRAAQVFTEDDISPFHWVNTRPPDEAQSAEWLALRADDFAGFRLQVGGLVREEKWFTVADLKVIQAQDQITLHTCMQGWTGIAKWSGIRLRDVLAQVEPLEGANYVMVESFGMAQHMHDGRPVEPYYTCLTTDMALEDETILAWGMNDANLPDMYGAPLRLRTESMHGYKMVKWVRSVTWIKDYRDVGDGMGGTREDSGYQDMDARI